MNLPPIPPIEIKKLKKKSKNIGKRTELPSIRGIDVSPNYCPSIFITRQEYILPKKGIVDYSTEDDPSIFFITQKHNTHKTSDESNQTQRRSAIRSVNKSGKAISEKVLKNEKLINHCGITLLHRKECMDPSSDSFEQEVHHYSRQQKDLDNECAKLLNGDAGSKTAGKRKTKRRSTKRSRRRQSRTIARCN